MINPFADILPTNGMFDYLTEFDYESKHVCYMADGDSATDDESSADDEVSEDEAEASEEAATEEAEEGLSPEAEAAATSEDQGETSEDQGDDFGSFTGIDTEDVSTSFGGDLGSLDDPEEDIDFGFAHINEQDVNAAFSPSPANMADQFASAIAEAIKGAEDPAQDDTLSEDDESGIGGMSGAGAGGGTGGGDDDTSDDNTGGGFDSGATAFGSFTDNSPEGVGAPEADISFSLSIAENNAALESNDPSALTPQDAFALGLHNSMQVMNLSPQEAVNTFAAPAIDHAQTSFSKGLSLQEAMEVAAQMNSVIANVEAMLGRGADVAAGQGNTDPDGPALTANTMVDAHLTNPSLAAAIQNLSQIEGFFKGPATITAFDPTVGQAVVNFNSPEQASVLGLIPGVSALQAFMRGDVVTGVVSLSKAASGVNPAVGFVASFISNAIDAAIKGPAEAHDPSSLTAPASEFADPDSFIQDVEDFIDSLKGPIADPVNSFIADIINSIVSGFSSPEPSTPGEN